jgi:putative oxidoreductase
VKSREAVKFLRSLLAARLAGAALGIVFIAAAVPKIVDPPGFAHEVSNYRLLPGAAVNAVALVLPWAELFAGLALVIGYARRSAAVLTLGLLAVFLGGLTLNLARNHPVDCGCFSTKEAPKTPEERLSAMKLAILRDVGFVLLGLWSLKRERSPSPSSDAA